METEIFKILDRLHQHSPEEADVLKRNKIRFDISRRAFSLFHDDFPEKKGDIYCLAVVIRREAS